MSNRTSKRPFYMDREGGKEFADAASMVNEYLARYTERAKIRPLSLDESGHVVIPAGSSRVELTVVEDHGVLLMVAPIMDIRDDHDASFFRRLLELSLISTQDAAFAVDETTGMIVVRALRRLSSLDYEEFEDLVHTVGSVADTWDDVLQTGTAP